MKVSVAGIDIYKNKAYMPVMGQTESGLFIDTEPVYVCDLSEEEMTKNLQRVRDAGHPLIQEDSPEEQKKHSKILLKATGTKSWKELARTGYSYLISWSDKNILIQMSRLDKQGRWEFDPEKNQRLPPDASLEDMIRIILEDVRSR